MSEQSKSPKYDALVERLDGQDDAESACNSALAAYKELEAELAALTAQDNAKARLQAIREIYNGMDGFEPKTAPEDYLLRIVRQMYHAAIREEGT